MTDFFHDFLSIARQRRNKIIVHWAIMSAGEHYGRKIGEIVNRRVTYLGVSVTTKTFLRAVQPFSDSMLSIIGTCLSSVDKTVWTIDNNQRGHTLKYQRFGISNTFVKVTGRACCKCMSYNDDTCNENKKRLSLTCVNQSIANPINFSIIEKDM